jgi:hypothetical protein
MDGKRGGGWVFWKKPVVGKAAGRSMSGLHDEVVEEEKGGRFSKWEIDEKFESSDEGVGCREEDGLSRKITRTED